MKKASLNTDNSYENSFTTTNRGQSDLCEAVRVGANRLVAISVSWAACLRGFPNCRFVSHMCILSLAEGVGYIGDC